MRIRTQIEKDETQKWLRTIPFSHLITVEPTPSLPFKRDEVIQRMRTLEYQLNKRYLKSSFPRWNDENRFWMVGFKEGDGVSHEIHYHLLLHSPQVLHKKVWYANAGRDLLMDWTMLPSINPFTGKRRRFCLSGKPLLNIQSVENVCASATYCSKWIRRIDESEDFFFTTPPTKKKQTLAVAA